MLIIPGFSLFLKIEKIVILEAKKSKSKAFLYFLKTFLKVSGIVHTMCLCETLQVKGTRKKFLQSRHLYNAKPLFGLPQFKNLSIVLKQTLRIFL